MDDLAMTAVEYAAAWLSVNNVELPFDIIKGLAAAKFNAGQELADIEDEYNTKLYGVMDDYTSSEKPITAFRNAFKRVVYEGFFATGQAGWIDAGKTGPISDELTAYINDRFDRETAYIDDLFAELKAKRKDGTPDEIASYIKQRADGYTGTLEGVYNYAKMSGNREQMGVWRYGDTVNHCETSGGKIGCADLEGEVHPLAWFIERGYIPRQKGSTTLVCGGWKCDCRVEDPETGERLI